MALSRRRGAHRPRWRAPRPARRRSGSIAMPRQREGRIDLDCRGEGITLAGRVTTRGGQPAGGSIDRRLRRRHPLPSWPEPAPVPARRTACRSSTTAATPSARAPAGSSRCRLQPRPARPAQRACRSTRPWRASSRSLLEGPPQRDTLLPAVLASAGRAHPSAPLHHGTVLPPPFTPAECAAALSETHWPADLQPFCTSLRPVPCPRTSVSAALHGRRRSGHRRRLDGCAERIAYRLAMWSVPPQPARKPMPPAAVLPDARFAQSDDLAAMRRLVCCRHPRHPHRPALPERCSPADTPAFPPPSCPPASRSASMSPDKNNNPISPARCTGYASSAAFCCGFHWCWRWAPSATRSSASARRAGALSRPGSALHVWLDRRRARIGFPYWIWQVLPKVCPQHLPGRATSRSACCSKPAATCRWACRCAAASASTGSSSTAPPATQHRAHHARCGAGARSGMPAHRFDIRAFESFFFNCAADPKFSAEFIVPEIAAAKPDGSACSTATWSIRWRSRSCASAC